MTIKDIAREAGVSTATVSRALNSPELVSEKKRKAIEAIVEKYGYTMNAAAREMVTRRTHLIGVVVPDITNTYVATALDSFAAALGGYGYSMFISVSNMKAELELDYLDNLKSKRVEAVVLPGNRLLSPEHDRLLAEKLKGTPILRIGNTNCEEFYCADPDEEQGAFQAIEYLIGLGHTRIAFLNGSVTVDSFFHKQQGVERAMKKHGIPIRPEYMPQVDTGNYGYDSYHTTVELLRLPQRPTAIFTAGDQFALGIYKAASVLGYQIPSDLSVVGFSGSPLSESIYPALTTISQYAHETGKQAARYLMEILEGEEETPRRIQLRAELVVRDSCAVPAAEKEER